MRQGGFSIVPNFRIEEISSRGDLTVTPELVEFLQMAQALVILTVL